MKKWFKKLFCRHNNVHVIRWHPDVLRPDMTRKTLLYVDELGVYNFVECLKCKKILHSNQSQKLFRMNGE